MPGAGWRSITTPVEPPGPAKLDVAAADLKAKKEKLILAQEAKENAKAQAAEYKEGGKEAKAEEKAADEGKAKEAKVKEAAAK